MNFNKLTCIKLDFISHHFKQINYCNELGVKLWIYKYLIQKMIYNLFCRFEKRDVHWRTVLSIIKIIQRKKSLKWNVDFSPYFILCSSSWCYFSKTRRHSVRYLCGWVPHPICIWFRENNLYHLYVFLTKITSIWYIDHNLVDDKTGTGYPGFFLSIQKDRKRVRFY